LDSTKAESSKKGDNDARLSPERPHGPLPPQQTAANSAGRGHNMGERRRPAATRPPAELSGGTAGRPKRTGTTLADSNEEWDGRIRIRPSRFSGTPTKAGVSRNPLTRRRVSAKRRGAPGQLQDPSFVNEVGVGFARRDHEQHCQPSLSSWHQWSTQG
jgi:hypothetical protein